MARGYRGTQPVATAEPPDVQPLSGADETRVNLLDVPARAAYEHRLIYQFLRTLEQQSRFNRTATLQRLGAGGGSVRDALLEAPSLIDPVDMDGYACEVRKIMLAQCESKILRRQRELDTARDELEACKRFLNGDMDDE